MARQSSRILDVQKALLGMVLNEMSIATIFGNDVTIILRKKISPINGISFMKTIGICTIWVRAYENIKHFRSISFFI